MTLRARTRDDLDVLFSSAADLPTGEKRNPSPPALRTREWTDARLARAAESDSPEGTVSFVIVIGAIRAHEEASFVVEGRQRQHAWVRGGYEDIVLMGVLRSEHTLRA